MKYSVIKSETLFNPERVERQLPFFFQLNSMLFYSTPSGLGLIFLMNNHRLHLWLFILNPFGIRVFIITFFKRLLFHHNLRRMPAALFEQNIFLPNK